MNMRTRNMMARLLTSGAFGGMTANERRLGRFLRDGEGHPDPVTVVDVPDADPAPKADADPVIPSVDDLYDQEFGGVDPATPEADEGEEGPADPPQPEPEPKPEGASVQERIDELTAGRREAERQVAEERRAREALEARIAELEGKGKPADPKATKERGPDEAPNPDDYEFGEADSKFIADHAAFYALKAVAERQNEQAVLTQLENIETGWKEAVGASEIVEQYPDFEDVVTKGADTNAWACTPVMALLVKSSTVGPDVAYYLAKNPDESRRIAGLADNEQVLEIGRLEGRYLARRESAATAEAPAPKKVTEAPTPPASRSRGAGGQFQAAQDQVYDKMLSEFK